MNKKGTIALLGWIILIIIVIAIVVIGIIRFVHPKEKSINNTMNLTNETKENPIIVNETIIPSSINEEEIIEEITTNESPLDSGCTTYCQSRPWASCYDSCIKSGSK